jgi:hypothetical protein
MAEEDSDRCWPGYEPVPGKPEHAQGSCRPGAESKLTPKGKKVRAARKRQLDKWQKEHPGSPRKAAQHLPKPRTAKKK